MCESPVSHSCPPAAQTSPDHMTDPAAEEGGEWGPMACHLSQACDISVPHTQECRSSNITHNEMQMSIPQTS